MDLLEHFESLFPDAQIRCLTADREFVGQEWCSFLLLPDHHPQTALTDYRLRWGTETLSAALKARGFNLESTHFCHPERLSKLIALLSLAFCWAMLSGLWQHQQHPIRLKAHQRRSRQRDGILAKSLFCYGCDFLRRTFCDFSLRPSEFNQALQLLSLY